MSSFLSLHELISLISLFLHSTLCDGTLIWYKSLTALPNRESDHASCLDSQGRLHIVGGSAGEDPIRRIDLNTISLSQGKDKMLIQDDWELIDVYPDYSDARNR